MNTVSMSITAAPEIEAEAVFPDGTLAHLYFNNSGCNVAIIEDGYIIDEVTTPAIEAAYKLFNNETKDEEPYLINILFE